MLKMNLWHLKACILILLILTTVSAGCATAPQSQNDKNIMIIKGIVETYYKSHTYSKTDMYACAQMSQDVWDMVKTKGITAVIYIGNVDNDISTITDSNHAWVMAEVSPDRWIAMETTGGFLVCADNEVCSVNNDRYYHGYKFSNPKELQAYMDILEHPCEDGYILGDDALCHPACGGNQYCTGDNICMNGECRGCNAGYIIGQDYRCHQECPIGSGKYCINGVCGKDGNCYA